ncbi:MAG: glycosyltransferase family 4 protein [Solirubrobacterales bacterium]|nr:glycosyltransferase family 4 protein [Solirubrobacterales bacterium]
MKILFLSHQYPPESGWGGIASYVATISRALVRRGHEVHVLCCWGHQEPVDRVEDGVAVHRRRNMRLRGSQRLLGAPVVSAAARRFRVPADQVGASPSWRLATAATCFREYRRLGVEFDVVESPDWMAEGLMFALRGSVPLVVDFKGNLLTYAHGGGQQLGWHGRLSNQLERTTVLGGTVLTSPSLLTMQFLAEAGWRKASSARVIRRPVDLQQWQVTPAHNTRPVIVQMGRLETVKAPDVLIRAAALLAGKVPAVEVVFVGATNGQIDGQPAGVSLERLAAKLGVQCRFAGHAAWSEMSHWYQRARVIALASRFDNFPNVGLEAMASGRPVVCSSRTGLAELADDADRSLAVVPPDDPAALADALEPYLADSRFAAEAGEQGRACVERLCHPQVIAAERELAYADAVDGVAA